MAVFVYLKIVQPVIIQSLLLICALGYLIRNVFLIELDILQILLVLLWLSIVINEGILTSKINKHSSLFFN